MSNEIVMSDDREIMEETAKLMNLIGSIEEKVRVNELELTETEKVTLEKAKLRLSELEKADAKELQRIINDSIEAGEGLFPDSKKKEIKEE